MADEADQASALEDLDRHVSLQNRNAELPITGECHFCSEPICDRKFCDADCRDLWEQLQHRLR